MDQWTAFAWHADCRSAFARHACGHFAWHAQGMRARGVEGNHQGIEGNCGFKGGARPQGIRTASCCGRAGMRVAFVRTVFWPAHGLAWHAQGMRARGIEGIRQ